ncbi:Nuclear pore, partial [Hyphodiscus hymeniophilus]
TAAMGPFNAYKETRLNLDRVQGATIAIRLPQHGTPTWPPKGQKQSVFSETLIAEDESAFRQRNLATSASIYHRTHHKSPKSFLWRILEDGKVLSIRVVDILKQTGVADFNLTLRLYFTDPIKPGCIALSDSKEHDVLSVFVLTEKNHLFTLSLRPEHFRKPSSTEENMGDWCKSYLSGQFAFKKPFRLVTLSADQLLVSYQDGELTRLARRSGGDGTLWAESHYREKVWSIGLSYFKGSHTVPYGRESLHLSAAISVSPCVEIDGVPHVFTIRLDHQLRIWNLSTGRSAYIGDILDQELDPDEADKQVIDPSNSRLVQVLSTNENVVCVTYSPLGTGHFKFWAVSPAEEGNVELVDMFTDNELVPRAPTSDLWTLADFSVAQGQSDVRNFTLWTLWKNNTTYRVQKLEFQGGSNARVRDAWASGWEAMAAETVRDMTLPSVYHGDASDATDNWQEFILTPGRFTPATIETGLAIYERGLGEAKDALRSLGHLPERMCSTIASIVLLGRTSDGHMDFEQYRRATDTQWRRFYRLLVELDKQRGEALSLVIGAKGELPLVVLADGVVALRECSGLEQIWHNPEMIEPGSEHVAALIMSAVAFRESFSDQLLHSCKTTLLEELFEEPTLVGPARMRLFYEKCDFANQIGEDDYAQLVTNLGGSFKNVTMQVYDALLDLLSASDDVDKRPHLLPLAEFGNKLVVKGVQETIELHRNVCLDQLVLLILIEAEINHGEDGLQFEAASVFNQLLAMLKRLELINWLAGTQITLPLARTERSASITEKSPTHAKKSTSTAETVTVLEGVLRHLFGLDTRSEESQASALTEIITQICAPYSEYETPPAVIQCFLLKHERSDLALEFSRFASNDPFSTYVQGRASLIANDPSSAAMLFKKAAFGIGFPDSRKRTDYRSAGFLDETERNLLNAGVPHYYSHIVTLFDKRKNYAYTIDFARLSLQFIKPGDADLELSHLRTDMYSRLFNAAIQTCRYNLAHSILALFTDAALRHSSLRTLVTKMCESFDVSELIELPFIGLQEAVDEILAQKCQSLNEVTVGIPYHKILYAWRIKRNDFRGAAAISLSRLQKLQQAGEGDRTLGEDLLETPVTKQYVALINVLSCVDPKQAWIFQEELPPKSSATARNAPKRKVVTLDDIRKSYQEEMDRIATIENNEFAFAGDEMDVL